MGAGGDYSTRAAHRFFRQIGSSVSELHRFGCKAQGHECGKPNELEYLQRAFL
jgi:hypothetical protein